MPQFFDRLSVTHWLHRRETVETAQRNHSVVLAIARVQPECLKIQRWRLEQSQLELPLARRSAATVSSTRGKSCK